MALHAAGAELEATTSNACIRYAFMGSQNWQNSVRNDWELPLATSEFGTGLCLSVNRLARVSLTPKKLPTSTPKKSHMVHFQTCQALCKVHCRLAFARWVHGRISTILDFSMWKTFWVAVLQCKAAVMQCMQCLPCKRCTWNDCSEVYSCLLSLTIPLWAGLNIYIYIYIWGFLEMLFPELCDNSCLRWGPPYNSFILGSSLHMCKILMRSSLCVVFSLARTFLASLGRTAAAAAAMHCCCHP